MKKICLIPIRSGSKGLKNKNIAFLGKYPLAVHTIDAAINSGLFKEENIFISTDSNEYIEVLKRYRPNISYVKRSDDLAKDTTTSKEVINDFLNGITENFSLCLLQATSPLRNSVDLQKAYKIFVKNELKPVVSVTKSEKSLDLFSELYQGDKLKDIVGIDKGYRRQDKKDFYAPNGAIYIALKEEYLKKGTFFTKNTVAYVMNTKNSIDIDTIDDYLKAKALIKSKIRKPIKYFCNVDTVFLSDGRYLQNFKKILNISQINVDIISYLKLLKNEKREIIISVGNNVEENKIDELEEVLLNLNLENIVLLSVLEFKYRPDLYQNFKKVNNMLKKVATNKGYKFIDLNDYMNKIEFYLDGYQLNKKGEEFLERILENK